MRDTLRHWSGPGVILLIERGLDFFGWQGDAVAVGLWGIALVWASWALFTWEPLVNRLPWEIRFSVRTRRKSDSPIDQSLIDYALTPRGFLDFLRDGQRNMSVFSTHIVGMTKDMQKYNRILTNGTKALLTEQQKRKPSIEKAHRLTTNIATQINDYADRMKKHLDIAEPAAKAGAEDYTSYLEWFAPSSEQEKEQLKTIRTSIAALIEIAPQTRESIATLRESTVGLQKLGVSRDITDACGRLIEVLNRKVNMLSSVSAFSLQAIKIMDEKPVVVVEETGS